MDPKDIKVLTTYDLLNKFGRTDLLPIQIERDYYIENGQVKYTYRKDENGVYVITNMWESVESDAVKAARAG